MFRKVTLSLVAAILVAGSVTAIPASAATKISNGVACKKVNAKTTSNGSKYICAKNLLVKNSKLTWLSQDCVNLMKSYVKSNANLPKIKASTEETIAKLDADLLIQKVKTDKANQLIADYTSKIATIKIALDALKIDSATATKNKLTIIKYEGAIKSYGAAIKAYAAVARGLSTAQAARDRAPLYYENAKSELQVGREMAQLTCEPNL